MKLLAIIRFEFAYQVRRAWPWLFFAVVLLLSFLMGRDTSVADAMYEEFDANSPFAIAKSTVVGTLVWLLLAPAIAGEAAARDVATGMHPLAYTVPVTKTEYLGGRFLAALILNALILLAVQMGILLGIYSPGVNASVIGPFRPAAFLTAYCFISLPTAFVATALQFFLAERSGRAMTSYVGSLFLVFMGFFVGTVLNFFVKQGLGTLLDPIGIQYVVEDLAHEWTPIERSTRLLALEGTFLGNRLFWLGVGVGALTLAYLRFRFTHRVESGWWIRLTRSLAGFRAGPFGWFRPAVSSAHALMPGGIGATASAPIAVPRVTRTFGFGIDARKAFAIAWSSFRTIATSWAGLALLAAVPLMTVLILLDQMGTMGAPIVPRTALVLRELTGGLSAELSAEPNRWVIVPLFIVFFAGELVWREREAGAGEITDAMPGSEWAPLIGKFLGLGLLLVAFTTFLTAAGILAQTIMGYRDFEIGLYLKILFGLQLPEYLLFTVLALMVHALVNQKYIGHLTAILAYAFIAVLASLLGIEHKLLVYAAASGWSYTEMRGFGASLWPWLWFKLYWTAWAVLLAVVAKLLWVRGKETGLGVRIRLAHRRVTRATAWTAAAAMTLIVVLGGFIFYNTNVLHEYLSTAEIKGLRAEYERRYRRYENTPQPHLTRTTLRVELYPERGAVDIRGSYRLVNRTALPIDTIHVATAAAGVETKAMTFDRTATLVVDDREHAYRIYDLERPLEPGDSLRLDFEVRVERRGFGNRGVDRSVVPNGTYFTSNAWFPFIGYQRFRELLRPAERRAHGLAPRPVLASLYEVEGREPASRAGGVAFEAVMGTNERQVAVAPGALRRTWTESGRRYFHYSTDAPIGTEWAFFSADYAVHEAKWQDSRSGQEVSIRTFHHPQHTAHLDRVTRSVRSSLAYYTEQFGPYPYGHLTIVEHPGAPGTGAHADPSIISHGEGFPFWIPKDEEHLDTPYFVMAHEMAHEWTVPYALVEGLPFLAEGLATYSAIQLVKASRGEEQFRRLMAFMREPYPYRPIRRGEPLLRALDPYLSRRKGPFAMLALTDYVGSDQVNGAIRRLIVKADSAGSAPMTTLDLYRELKAVTPDSLQYLLHDLFRVNTYWELVTEQVTAKQNADSSWQVSLDLRARKVVYDSAGIESEVPMDEWVEIGVFAPREKGDELGNPLYVQKHRIRSGKQAITVTVSRRPVLAGIDPYHVLDWEEKEDDDNVEVVNLENSGSPISGRVSRTRR